MCSIAGTEAWFHRTNKARATWDLPSKVTIFAENGVFSLHKDG
jgi:hypothetical protein